MGCISSRHAAAVDNGRPVALGPVDALDALNMQNTEDTLKTTDEHDTEESFNEKCPVDSFFAIVSFDLSAVLYSSLT